VRSPESRWSPDRGDLAENLPAIIEGLRWPKMMRWGAASTRTSAPSTRSLAFRWQHLPITIFVSRRDETVGHRTLASAPIEVTSHHDYVSKLELSHVVVDAMRRAM